MLAFLTQAFFESIFEKIAQQNSALLPFGPALHAKEVDDSNVATSHGGSLN